MFPFARFWRRKPRGRATGAVRGWQRPLARPLRGPGGAAEAITRPTDEECSTRMMRTEPPKRVNTVIERRQDKQKRQIKRKRTHHLLGIARVEDRQPLLYSQFRVTVEMDRCRRGLISAARDDRGVRGEGQLSTESKLHPSARRGQSQGGGDRRGQP